LFSPVKGREGNLTRSEHNKNAVVFDRGNLETEEYTKKRGRRKKTIAMIKAVWYFNPNPTGYKKMRNRAAGRGAYPTKS
jgi:hypothetical protein